MVNRNQGSGTRVLIDRLLEGDRPAGYAVQPRNHHAVAAAVSQGRADWGVTLGSIAGFGAIIKDFAAGDQIILTESAISSANLNRATQTLAFLTSSGSELGSVAFAKGTFGALLETGLSALDFNIADAPAVPLLSSLRPQTSETIQDTTVSPGTFAGALQIARDGLGDIVVSDSIRPFNV